MRIRRVAATLLRNVERDVRNMLRRSREEQARLVEFAVPDDQNAGRHGIDFDFAGSTNPSAFGIPPGGDADQEARLLRDRLVQQIGVHADLVVAIFGERPIEVADRLGIAPEAARKRCQRALDSLRQRLSE